MCSAKMQDREEEGCWNITIVYVFIQEPGESSPRCTLQEFQFRYEYMNIKTADDGAGVGGVGGGGWEGGVQRGIITILRITIETSLKVFQIEMLDWIKLFNSF